MRTIQITFEVAWDDYDDVSTELLVEDMFEFCKIKDGITIKNIKEK